MNEGIKTSIQFHLTKSKLFNDVFYNWNVFSSYLNQGPAKMREYLFNEWCGIRNELMTKPNFIVKDVNRTISITDFDIKLIPTRTGIPVFYMIFPDYKDTDAACKCVALALCEKMPRYFTLETSLEQLTNKFAYMIGEIYVDYERKINSQKYYGLVDPSINIEQFSNYIQKILLETN